MDDRPAETLIGPVSPTQIRWLVLAVATLSSLLLYLDRICVSFAVESIRVEFRATQAQMGWFLGAFFWSYALGQVPAGWLSDRFGIRPMLTLYILLWSAFTALMGLSTGIVTLLAYRLGCGLAQAGAYPSCGRAVRDWMPLTTRGMASSVVAFGGRIGGAIAPLLTGAVMLWLALNGRSPQIDPEEVIDPFIVTRFLTPTESQVSPWVTLLQQKASVLPGDSASSRDQVAQRLNALDPLHLLADAPRLEALELPPELRVRVANFRERADTISAADHSLANRQFWEAAIPGGVRKLESRGWRMTLVIYGVAGIVVAVVFWLSFRNLPSQHPWCNAAEVAVIGETPVHAGAPAVASPFPWRAILTSCSLWGNCISQLGTNIGWLFLVTWLPRYLDEVHKVPVLERGVMSSLPIFAGMIGMLAGGPWTDQLATRWGLRWSRAVPIASSRLMAMTGYGLCLLANTGVFDSFGPRAPVYVVIAGLAIVAIATDLGVAAAWAYAQDVGGRHTAAVLGWANMWGNLGAAVAPLLYNQILGEKPTLAAWSFTFAFCAGAFFLAAIAGWFMDSSRPLEDIVQS